MLPNFRALYFILCIAVLGADFVLIASLLWYVVVFLYVFMFLKFVVIYNESLMQLVVTVLCVDIDVVRERL